MTAPLKHPVRGISVAARERPFDGRMHTRTIAPGDYVPTVAEILAGLDEVPAGFASICEARINGELVPREFWHLVRPRFGGLYDVAVTFTIPMRGGGSSASGSGGGGKSTLATVATIGVLLAAAAVSGGALGLAGVGFLSAGAVNAVAGAAVGIGGSLAISALVPPPSLSPNQQQTPVASLKDSVPASLSGNVIAPGAPVPRVLGTMKVYPPFGCEPLVEIVSTAVPGSNLLVQSGFSRGSLAAAGSVSGSTDEYAEVVLVLSGPHELSDLRIGDVKADDIPELEYEFGDGLTPGARPTLVTRYGKTISPGTELPGHSIRASGLVDGASIALVNQSDPDLSSPQWVTFVSGDSPDEIWLNLAWVAGLTDASQGTINQAVRVRFRKRGDVVWINCPEVHFSSSVTTPFQRSVRFIWGTIPASPNTPPTAGGAVYAYKVVPGQTSKTPVTAGWTAASHFSSGSGDDLLNAATISTSKVENTELHVDKAIFYLDEGTYPKGIYEVQVMRSCPYISSLFTAATYVYSQVSGAGGAAVYDFFRFYTYPATSTLTTPLSGAVGGMIAMSRVSSVWNENPIQSDDFAWIALRIHARAASQISVLAKGYTRDWDGSAWATQMVTSNPAPHFYEVLTGALGGSPVDASIVNSSEIVAWRTACIANNYTINAVIEGKTYLDVLNLIASSGYARVRHNERWGVFRDKDRSADVPVQIFSARNMRNFAWTRAFLKRPTGIRAQFADADNDYNDSEIIVYDNPLAPDGSDLAQFRYDGLTDEDDVEARATFDLLQSRLRYTFYRGEADIESLVCERGDLVGVQHDILMKQAGFAYIVSVTTSNGLRTGGNVTGLVLEGTIPNAANPMWSDPDDMWSDFDDMWRDGRHGIAIRYRNGNGSVIKEITNTDSETSVIAFSTPFSDPGVSFIDAGTMIVSGPLGSEYKRLIVFGVNPQADLTAQLTFVDEAPALFQ